MTNYESWPLSFPVPFLSGIVNNCGKRVLLDYCKFVTMPLPSKHNAQKRKDQKETEEKDAEDNGEAKKNEIVYFFIFPVFDTG
jgi:hypothetical protein